MIHKLFIERGWEDFILAQQIALLLCYSEDFNDIIIDIKTFYLFIFQIKDEFLIGNYLLVAPVLCEGTTERDVYVPSGVWENVDTKAIVLGPTTIRILNVTLQSTVMFQRRSVTGEMRSKLDF